MKNVTIVKDVKQASKAELENLLATISDIYFACIEDVFGLICWENVLKKSPLAIQVLVEESDGDIGALRRFADEIMASQ